MTSFDLTFWLWYEAELFPFLILSIYFFRPITDRIQICIFQAATVWK